MFGFPVVEKLAQRLSARRNSGWCQRGRANGMGLVCASAGHDMPPCLPPMSLPVGRLRLRHWARAANIMCIDIMVCSIIMSCASSTAPTRCAGSTPRWSSRAPSPSSGGVAGWARRACSSSGRSVMAACTRRPMRPLRRCSGATWPLRSSTGFRDSPTWSIRTGAPSCRGSSPMRKPPVGPDRSCWTSCPTWSRRTRPWPASCRGGSTRRRDARPWW